MNVSEIQPGAIVLGRYTGRQGIVTAVTRAGLIVRFADEEPHCYHPLLHLLDQTGQLFEGSLLDLVEDVPKRESYTGTGVAPLRIDSENSSFPPEIDREK